MGVAVSPASNLKATTPGKLCQDATRRSRTREVTSRYLSTSSSSSNSASTSSTLSSSHHLSSRRCLSPGPAMVKRSQSAERRRPVALGLDGAPSGVKRSTAAKMLVSLNRSLSVSFQEESFSVPINKLKPTPSPKLRKATPERSSMTPVATTPSKFRDRGRNIGVVEQHPWPSRFRGVSSPKSSTARSGNVVRNIKQSLSNGIGRIQCVGTSHAVDRNTIFISGNSSNGSILTSELAASDAQRFCPNSKSSPKDSVSSPRRQARPQSIIVPARLWQESSNTLRCHPEFGTTLSRNDSVKATNSSTPRGSQTSRGVSPLRSTIKPCSPRPSTGKSHLLKAVSSSGRFSGAVTDVSADSTARTSPILCLSADARRRKSGDDRVVNTHLLRLLYNQHLQWRFANARADAALSVQQTSAEGILYNAWRAASALRISVFHKRLDLARLTLKLRLTSILCKQMTYLDEWAIMETDHSGSLQGLLESLKASIVRLPTVNEATADIQCLRDAMLSAYNILQAMVPSVRFLLSKVELVYSFLSEMATVTYTQHTLLAECKDYLSALAALQVRDYSLRAHTLQLKRAPLSSVVEV